jgi:hypothetical protein
MGRAQVCYVGLDDWFEVTTAALKSPSVNVAGDVMQLQTQVDQLEVDWRGKAPELSKQ